MSPDSDWHATSEATAASLPGAVVTGALGAWAFAVFSAILDVAVRDARGSLPEWGTLGATMGWLAAVGAVGGLLGRQSRRAPNEVARQWLRLTGSCVVLSAGMGVGPLRQFGPGPWLLILTLASLIVGTAGTAVGQMAATLFPSRAKGRNGGSPVRRDRA